MGIENFNADKTPNDISTGDLKKNYPFRYFFGEFFLVW
jgi:hypothetical protein